MALVIIGFVVVGALFCLALVLINDINDSAGD